MRTNISQILNLGRRALSQTSHLLGPRLEHEINLITPNTHFHRIRLSHSQGSVKLSDSFFEKSLKAHTKCRYKRLIKEAVREKGSFVEYNPILLKLVEEAKSHDVSDASIDYSIKAVLDGRPKLGMVEILFPGKCFLVGQYESIDIANLEHKIMYSCDSYDATYITRSRRHDYYDQEGIVTLASKKDGAVLQEADASNLESDEIHTIEKEVDLNGNLLISLFCDVTNLIKIKRHSESRGYHVEEAYVGLVPKKNMIVPVKNAESVSDLLLDLSDLPEIDRLFTNVQ